MIFWIALLVFVSFFSGFVVAVKIALQPERSYQFSQDGQSYEYFDPRLYSEVISLLKKHYVEKDSLNDRELFYGALRGLVAAIGDPYTVFFSPKAHDEFDEELKGSFDGIGAELGIKNNRLTVIAPLANSPAEKAGLRAGDVILSIDGTDTSDLTLDGAVSRIRGKSGTTVKLNVFRDGNGEQTLSISIQRATIVLPTVRLAYEGDVAHLSLYSFNSEAEKQFVQSLRELQDRKISGLIIDLRNNPGGFLDEAVNIASAWLDKGQVVVREVYQADRSANEFPAIGQLQAPRVPTVVLVNEGTASASEILAGALQDYKKATVIGVTTYGKGSVQELKTLPDGSGLKITVSQWLTPLGRFINKHGIDPDIEVKMTAEDYTADRDPQLERALEFIRGQSSL